jgi:glycosyltransferase involved in cell wall biosynthesis
MAPHVRTMRREYGVTLVASGRSALLEDLLDSAVSFHQVTIPRGISPVADIRALYGLYALFCGTRFEVVHSITPKGGLLAMIAARLAGVPFRIHWFTGQVWATKRGVSRWMLKIMDRLLVACATHLLADSPSQAAFLAREGVVASGQVTVLGGGSVCGVDTQRFRPNPPARSAVRAGLAISDEAVVALYLGRLAPDKGVLELASAFSVAARACPELHLLVVGPDEGGMRSRMDPALAPVLNRVRFVEYTAEPHAYMAAADIFLLPSHREGFGSSVIEAAACEVPAIGTRIYGLCDALVEGETGLLVPPGDADALSAALVRLACDGELRRRMGRTGRERVHCCFLQERLTADLMAFYQGMLARQAATT